MSRIRLPPLSALRAFEAAARHLSFRDAGDELCVTHSAVSHQVKLLERELGGPLFWRKGRRVELTEAGAMLYPVLRDSFARIGETAARIKERGASGDLTVQVYVTVASRWLLPRLHRFEAKNPDLHLRLSTSHRSWDLDAENVDVGMIYKEPPLDPDLAWWPLFRACLVAVASPGLVQGGMGLRQPAELVNHRLLGVDAAEADWPLWLEAAGAGQLARRRGPLFDSYLLALEAAIDGQFPGQSRPQGGTGRPALPFARAAAWRLASRLPQGAPAGRPDRALSRLAAQRGRSRQRSRCR
jgi:LysR family glycine cleavage system transcriptional activator